MGIKNTVTKAMSRSSLKVKKNSPHILFVGGLAGVITATVLACRATLKLDRSIDDIGDEIARTKLNVEEGNATQRDLAEAYARNSARVVGAYAPAIIVGGVSIAMLTGSHIQLTRRNTALTVAYTALHQAYAEYRERVREEVGEEKELLLYQGISLEDAKNEKGELAQFKVLDPNKLSPYARFFDEGSPNWNNNAEYNRIYVQCQQNYSNNILQARGHLFLNEVYDMLGINRSQAGCIVGWVLNGDGDNYVDFGIFEVYNQGFVNGHEPSILLDFNVDGVVYDKI